jgi:hypothetical protein
MIKHLKSLTFGLSGLALGVALTYSALSWRSSDSQGEANSSCDKFDGPSVASARGMTISSHTTVCTTLGTSVVSYVYLHPSGQSPTAENLVFTYSQNGSDDSLGVEWIDERHVVLKVNHVSQVSKIQTTSGSVSIDYKIGGQ